MIIILYWLLVYGVLAIAVITGSWHLAVFATVMKIAFFAFIRKQDVDEGTAVSFKSLAQFAFFVIQGRKGFDDMGKVGGNSRRKTSGSSWLYLRIRGWVFYVWPFIKPTPYAETNDDSDFGRGNQVFMGEIALPITVENAETKEVGRKGKGKGKGKGKVALNVAFLVRVRIEDPYQWTFASPRDNVAKLKLGLQVLHRLVRIGSESDLQDLGMRGQEAVWDKLGPNGANCLAEFQRFQDEWGLLVIKNGVSILSVSYTPEYQKALESEARETLAAAGESRKLFDPIAAGIDAGLTREQAVELRSQGLAGDRFAYTKSESVDHLDVTSGGQPFNPTFAGAAAFVRILGRALGKQAQTPGSEKNKREGKSPENMTEEEKNAAFARLLSGGGKK